MNPISFFDPDIVIVPFAASDPEQVGKPISLLEFANGDPVGLAEMGDGSLYCKTQGYGRFIRGNEQHE